MATETLGTKFTCFMCQCRFYDLNRPQPICPRCGANQKEQPKQKAPASRARAAAPPPDRVREEVEVPHEAFDTEEAVGAAADELGADGPEEESEDED